jgi:hypothetical protein
MTRLENLARPTRTMIFLILPNWECVRMTTEERDRMYALCTLIQNEQDPKKFNCLLEELDRLLNTKRECIQASERAVLGQCRNFKT